MALGLGVPLYGSPMHSDWVKQVGPILIFTGVRVSAAKAGKLIVNSHEPIINANNILRVKRSGIEKFLTAPALSADRLEQ